MKYEYLFGKNKIYTVIFEKYKTSFYSVPSSYLISSEKGIGDMKVRVAYKIMC